MLRQVNPKTARGKRALAERDPKPVENPKTSLFLRYTSCSQVIQDCLSDLYSLRQPLSKRFTKKNSLHPFEDPSSLEFFSDKNDASLILFGSTSKKRPHTITFCRTFGGKMLDMLELHLDPSTFRQLKQFKGRKPPIGTRPMILFSGTAFESPVSDDYTMAKSMLLDFFRCEGGSSADSGKVDVEGLQYIVSITCDEPSSSARAESQPQNSDLGLPTTSASPAPKSPIRIRSYILRTKRSSAPGSKLPRVELEEMGPRLDFLPGRSRHPDGAMLKEALRKPKLSADEKSKKNVSTDTMGDKLGRIHLGRQDLTEMSIRKFKGLKRARDVAGGAEEGSGSDGEEAGKKRKI
ncbi:hypothetical protein MKZ38_005222 [Zalerion maritima]|uniref:Ribosome production factor 2 homolog n=1 Tax=Zalerion maritima TaxID=339359 RepID=A0AAD5RKB5_9PEZI|nr:hypothetical protein MKZ38_005222 [Zalerion maritima]